MYPRVIKPDNETTTRLPFRATIVQFFNLQIQWISNCHVWLLKLVGGLEHFFFSIYWECHHPNWRTHVFQDGYCTTNQEGYFGWFLITDFLPRDLADFIRQVDVDPDYADSLAAHAKDTALMWCGDGSKYINIYIYIKPISKYILCCRIWPYFMICIYGLHMLYMILGCLWECGIRQVTQGHLCGSETVLGGSRATPAIYLITTWEFLGVG